MKKKFDKENCLFEIRLKDSVSGITTEYYFKKDQRFLRDDENDIVGVNLREGGIILRDMFKLLSHETKTNS